MNITIFSLQLFSLNCVRLLLINENPNIYIKIIKIQIFRFFSPKFVVSIELLDTLLIEYSSNKISKVSFNFSHLNSNAMFSKSYISILVCK